MKINVWLLPYSLYLNIPCCMSLILVFLVTIHFAMVGNGIFTPVIYPLSIEYFIFSMYYAVFIFNPTINIYDILKHKNGIIGLTGTPWINGGDNITVHLDKINGHNFKLFNILYKSPFYVFNYNKINKKQYNGRIVW